MTEAVLQHQLTLMKYGLSFSYRLEQGRQGLERAYCAALKQINAYTFAGVIRDHLIGALESLKTFYEIQLSELALKRQIRHLRATGQHRKAKRLERSLNRL